MLVIQSIHQEGIMNNNPNFVYIHSMTGDQIRALSKRELGIHKGIAFFFTPE